MSVFNVLLCRRRLAGVLLLWIGSATGEPVVDARPSLSALGPSGVVCGVTGALGCGQTIAGSIDGGTDCAKGDGSFLDYYSFAGSVEQKVLLELRSSQFDTFLSLLDPDEIASAVDDDGGDGTDSRIVSTLNQGGEWTVLVNNAVVGNEGDYSLILSCGFGGCLSEWI